MLLLSIAFNYSSCGWNVVTIKPTLDTRSEWIETRAMLPPRKPDISISRDESIYDYKDIIDQADVVLIDECQFLTTSQVDELRNLSTDRDIDILFFGLRTDFNSNLFEASKRLFEVADEINEVKTICSVCGKHASFNKKIHMTENKETESNIDPGWDNFVPVCHKHFLEEKIY